MTRASLEAAIAKAQDAKHDARTRKKKNAARKEVARLCILADVYDAVSSMLETWATRYNAVNLHSPEIRAMMASDAVEGM